jgi:hypothetical protein
MAANDHNSDRGSNDCRRDGKSWISSDQYAELLALLVGRAAGHDGLPADEEPRLQLSWWEENYGTEAQRQFRRRATQWLTRQGRVEVLFEFDRLVRRRREAASRNNDAERVTPGGGEFSVRAGAQSGSTAISPTPDDAALGPPATVKSAAPPAQIRPSLRDRVGFWLVEQMYAGGQLEAVFKKRVTSLTIEFCRQRARQILPNDVPILTGLSPNGAANGEHDCQADKPALTRSLLFTE